jgi:hypothetical protein
LFVETPRKFITAVINLRGVSTNKTIIYFIAMQTHKELITKVARHIFQACQVWIYTQSNITQASYSPEYITPTQQISERNTSINFVYQVLDKY